MNLVVEYLLIVPNGDTFCDSQNAFNQLLQVDSGIKLKKNRLCSGDDFECDYFITTGKVAGKDQRYFHVRFSLDDAEHVDAFSGLLRKIRGIMSKLGNQPETLWDDVSFYYARQGYEKIYRIENLMRKLIANFMLVTVGRDWLSEASPKEFTEVVEKSKRKKYSSVLHSVDFIDLADFMLKPYSSKNASDLYGKLKTAKTVDDLAALKEYVPESNWTRYFSSLLSCEDSYLNTRWKELYDLRCKVAHNATVVKAEFERLSELVADLEGKLSAAIDKLPQVKVPQEEVEQIAENAAKNINMITGEFIREWQLLERCVMQAVAILDDESKPDGNRSMLAAAEYLLKKGILNSLQYGSLVSLSLTRNHVVHPTGEEVSESSLASALIMIRELLHDLGYFGDPSSPGIIYAAEAALLNWHTQRTRAAHIAAGANRHMYFPRRAVSIHTFPAPTAEGVGSSEGNDETP